MKITYVNSRFCEITGLSEEELLGKAFKSLGHSDNDKSIYKEMYANVLDNKPWHGKLKQKTSTGEAYVVDSYMITTYDEHGTITGSIAIQRDITKELNRQREVQVALMKDKGDIFIKSKEDDAKKSIKISHLEAKILELEDTISKNMIQVDKYIYAIDKL